MATNEKIEKIKNFWGEQALKHGSDYLATVPDKFVKELEIANISKYFPSESKGLRILDIGCGNGFSTLRYAQEYGESEFIGVDYSKEMIGQAQAAKIQQKKLLKSDVNFFVGDVLKLNFDNEEFDIITSDRCLINLISIEHQQRAIEEICRVLKKGGKYIMCEDTQEGLAKINDLRLLANLSTIKNHWHNLYISEEKLLPYIKRFFHILVIDNFSSTYYIGSRIFNALSAKDREHPNYLSFINEVAVKLPSLGDYSPLKILFLQKNG